MDRQGPPNRPRYQLTRGLTRIRHEKDAMTSRGKQEMKYDAPPGETVNFVINEDGIWTFSEVPCFQSRDLEMC